MDLLEIKNLSFKLGGQSIFAGLDLAIEPREIHALIGTNGSGKSSLAYIILGCEGYTPTDGEILFERRPIHALRLYERARLGITLCDTALHLTGGNVRLIYDLARIILDRRGLSSVSRRRSLG